MINHHRGTFTHFFGNKEVTSLYFTIALVRFAVGLVNVFVPIYLWELGYEIWQILLFFLLEAVFFVIFSFLLPPILRRLTDKKMLLLSVPFLVAYSVGLAFLDTVPILFYLLPTITVLKSILFNTGYHLDFSGASKSEDLGRELGTRFMIGALVSMSAPFLGGVIIAYFGFSSAFILSAFILLLAIVPLFYFPERHVTPKMTAKSLWRSVTDSKLYYHTLSNIGYANEFVVGWVIWKLFLFLSIGSIEQFGGVISIALFFSAMITFLAGMMTDNGKRKKVLLICALGTAVVWFLRPFITTASGAAASHIILHFFYPAMIVAWASMFYKMAKNSKQPTVFILGREVVTNISRSIFYTIMLLISLVVSLEQFFVISFILGGIFILFLIFANRQSTEVAV